MSGAQPQQPIHVVLNGEDFHFAGVDDLLAYAQRLKMIAREEWENRATTGTVEEALVTVASLSDAISKVAAAGIARIMEEEAQANAAITEIDRLFAELDS